MSSRLALLAMLLSVVVPAQTGVAYVVGEGNDLTRVDLANGSQSVVVPGLGRPQGMAVDGPRGVAYVIETATGELTKVDLATGALTLIGGGLVNPRQIRLRPTAGSSPPASAYVLEQPTGGQPSSISEIDLATGARIRVVVVDSNSWFLLDFAVVADGSVAYATWYTDGLVRIDLSSGAVTLLPILGVASGLELFGAPIAVNASGTRAYVASPSLFGGVQIWVVDLVANVMAPLVPADYYGGPSMGSALSADQETLFYIDYRTRIWAVDASAPLGALPTPLSVMTSNPSDWLNAYSGVGVHAGEIFATYSGRDSGTRVLACDISSGAIRVVTGDVLNKPTAIAVSPTTATAYVLDDEYGSEDVDKRLVRVDLVSGSMSTVVSGLQGATALTMSPSADAVYVSERTWGGAVRVSRVELATSVVSTVYNVSPGPGFWPSPILGVALRSTGALLALNVDEFFEVDLATSGVTVRAQPPLGGFRHLDAVAARDVAYVSYWQSSSSGAPPSLLRVELGTGAVQPVTGGPALAQIVRRMRGLRVAPDESFALFADVTGLASDEGRLVKYDFGTGAVSVIASTRSLPMSFDVLNTADGTDVQAVPVDSASGTSPVTLSFAEVTAPGETALTISATGTAVPAGFQLGSPATFYDVSTTSAFAGPVEICIDYAGVAFGDESTLQLLHYENGSWVNVTTSRDPLNDRICGVVSSFSPFVVVEFPAMGMLADLMNRVENLDVRHGIIVSLDAKLARAQEALASVLGGNIGAAVNSLQAFINAVNAQRGSQIPSETADLLIADAQAIIASLT